MDSTGTRKIYLIRHGELEFADGIRRCIGRTEIPLNESGRKQAERLYIYFQKHPVTKVFYQSAWQMSGNSTDPGKKTVPSPGRNGSSGVGYGRVGKYSHAAVKEPV